VQMSMVFAMAFCGSCPKCNGNLEAEQHPHIQWYVLMTSHSIILHQNTDKVSRVLLLLLQLRLRYFDTCSRV